MAIEQVAGESAGSSAPVDAGAGDASFTLPDSFEENIDEIEVPAEETPPEGGQEGDIRPLPASGATPRQAPGQQQTPPAAPQQSPQAPGQQQATPPQAPPAQAPAQSPQGGEGSGAPRIFTPGELAQRLGQNRDMLIEGLASQKFQLTPKDIQALEVDAVGVLPKLMARVYFEAVTNNLQQMANMVPRMVESVANTRIAETQSEDQFHTEWPNIDKNNAQHMQVVENLAHSYRQMNPNASVQDAIKYVGTAATAFLGLQMPQRGNGQVNGRGNGAPQPARRQPPPFAPAAGGRAQAMPGQTPANPHPFEGLGMAFDE